MPPPPPGASAQRKDRKPEKVTHRRKVQEGFLEEESLLPRLEHTVQIWMGHLQGCGEVMRVAGPKGIAEAHFPGEMPGLVMR